MNLSGKEFYFESLRLKMGGGGRFIARLLIYVFYGTLTASAVVLVFAELRWMQSLGVFLVLFLIDRLLHIHQAEEKLSHMSKEGRVNLALHLSPEGLSILEKAVDKASFIGGSFSLWVARECLSRPDIKKFVYHLGLQWKDIDCKANKLLKENKQRSKKDEILSLAENLVQQACFLALVKKSDYIEAKDLFIALGKISDLEAQQLFAFDGQGFKIKL